jgi:hypothetical protein
MKPLVENLYLRPQGGREFTKLGSHSLLHEDFQYCASNYHCFPNPKTSIFGDYNGDIK